jgi:DNA adenine methylase
MKTPITYYGGKQKMVKDILPLIPDHRLYCEPFVGGAAIYFSKPKSSMEVINDLNGHVINFYKVCKNDFAILRYLIQSTPHSRQIHREAEFILKNAEHFSEVKRAWAFWVQTNLSFSSRIFGGYAYERKSDKTLKRTFNKKLQFSREITDRLSMTDIECNDAIQVIKSRDTDESFFYVDPPYYNSDCGHYKGYTLQNFIDLLDCLQNLKGKFLLSSYPSDALSEYSKRNKWFSHSIVKKIAVSQRERHKEKTEVLTANYDFKPLLKVA